MSRIYIIAYMRPNSERKGKRVASEVNIFVCAGENEDEKLNEVMYEAWRFNRDCKLLRDGLQGLSWDGQYHFIMSISGKCLFILFCINN